MSTSAVGSVVDESGAGLKGLRVLLENASSLRAHDVLQKQKGVFTDGDGKFSLTYPGDFAHGDVPGQQIRQLRLRILLGQHTLKEILRPDIATQDQLSFDPIKLTRQEAESRWATLGTGKPSRMTQGNAIRW